MCIKITDSFLQKKKKQLIYLGSAASELDNSWSVLGKLLNSWATSAYWLPQWTLVMALKGSDNSSNFTPLQACWGKQHSSVIIFEITQPKGPNLFWQQHFPTSSFKPRWRKAHAIMCSKKKVHAIMPSLLLVRQVSCFFLSQNCSSTSFFLSQNCSSLHLHLLMWQCYAAGVYYLDNSSSPFEWITMSVLLNCFKLTLTEFTSIILNKRMCFKSLCWSGEWVHGPSYLAMIIMHVFVI